MMMMRWQWSPLSRISRSAASHSLQDGTDWDQVSPAFETATSPQLQAASERPYGENNKATDQVPWRDEARATRIRSTICFGLSIFAGVVVVVLLGIVCSSASAPKQQALELLHRIHTSSLVQFTITPKPRVVHERYGPTRTEAIEFYGFTSIRGQLLPRITDSSRVVAFDGWVHVQRLEKKSYDILLSANRGYRVTRSSDASGQCLTSTDFVPLHDLESAARRAFFAIDYGSFQLNCSHPPVEVVFAHIPLVFCPEDATSRSVSPTRNDSFSSESLTIHGEAMLIEIELVRSAEYLEKTHLHQPPWLHIVGEMASNCPSLEAPLTTYKPRVSTLLDAILKPDHGHLRPTKTSGFAG